MVLKLSRCPWTLLSHVSLAKKDGVFDTPWLVTSQWFGRLWILCVMDENLGTMVSWEYWYLIWLTWVTSRGRTVARRTCQRHQRLQPCSQMVLKLSRCPWALLSHVSLAKNMVCLTLRGFAWVTSRWTSLHCCAWWMKIREPWFHESTGYTWSDWLGSHRVLKLSSISLIICGAKQWLDKVLEIEVITHAIIRDHRLILATGRPVRIPQRTWDKWCHTSQRRARSRVLVNREEERD